MPIGFCVRCPVQQKQSDDYAQNYTCVYELFFFSFYSTKCNSLNFFLIQVGFFFGIKFTHWSLCWELKNCGERSDEASDWLISCICWTYRRSESQRGSHGLVRVHGWEELALEGDVQHTPTAAQQPVPVCHVCLPDKWSGGLRRGLGKCFAFPRRSFELQQLCSF